MSYKIDIAANLSTTFAIVVIDDFDSAKVKILDIRRGKYRIFDDKEGGKYIGRIVGASDVAHFEI
jgi:hypothetical protein